MYSKIKFILPLLLLVFLFLFQSDVEARSGCCSSHDGVCGCGCCDGTPLSDTCAPYYPNCGGGTTYYTEPVYFAPVCNKPDMSNLNGNWKTIEVDCKQNITFTWDKGVGDNQYSIAISKTAEADPGPKSDTLTRSMSFNGITPGKWYINLKGGNSCGWSRVTYWEIDVPVPEVAINRFYSEKRADGVTELKFDAKCGNNYFIAPNVGTLTQAQVNQGYVAVSPDKDTSYTLTVVGHGQTKKSSLTAKAPTPIPSPSPIIEEKIDEVNEETFELNDENKENLDQDSNDFWNRIFSSSTLTTIARILILKF